jgi:hypothetical protein
MQEFRSIDAIHQFKVDRGVYFLPAFGPADLEPVGAIAKLTPQEQVGAFGALLSDRARTRRGPFLRRLTGWKSPEEAVECLSIAQKARLFKAWSSGAGEPGESSSSAD